MTESERIEFGDFQTPPALAGRVMDLLSSRGVAPRTVLEPTCGLGSFVEASLASFRESSVVAYDINPDYVHKTAALDRLPSTQGRLTCRVGNFFTHDWTATISSLPEPVLVVGNPPWVTASGLGALGSANVPQKSNFQHRRGLDALTGKSNFDVAEAADRHRRRAHLTSTLHPSAHLAEPISSGRDLSSVLQAVSTIRQSGSNWPALGTPPAVSPSARRPPCCRPRSHKLSLARASPRLAVV